MLAEIAQMVVLGLIGGSLYALLGVSWGIIYSTTRIFHFAHGLTFTFAAYMMIVLHLGLGLPLLLAVPAGLGLGALFGCGIELLIYRPIRRAGGGQLGIFLASIGTLVLGVALLQICFTPTPRTLPNFPEALFSLGPIFFTAANICLVATAWVSIGLLEWFLSATRGGREIRAVQSNPEMATVVGIDADRTFLWAFALGSLMMGLGAFFVTIQSAATPHMGLTFVLMAFIATFLGGVGKNLGVALAGLAMGLVEHLSLLILPASYKDTVIFALMLVFLLIKPEGLMGASRKLK